MSLPPDAANALIRLLKRVTWLNDGVIEAHALGTAPGDHRKPWEMSYLRSITNVYRLSFPPEKLTEWGRSGDAAARLMRAHAVDPSIEESWSRTAEMLANWAATVLALPETEPWEDTPLQSPSRPEAPAVARIDLMANVLHPEGAAAIQVALADCIAHCESMLGPSDEPTTFEAQARDRVSGLGSSIDIDAFTTSFNLFRTSTRFIHDLESTVHRPKGLSTAGFRVLFTVWVLGEAQPRQIASLSGVSRAAVSGVVRTLETAGLVDKARDANDGRLITVTLTANGRALLEDRYRAQNEREVELFSHLDRDEVEELGRLLRKLAQR